jgi:hypothetical protein
MESRTGRRRARASLSSARARMQPVARHWMVLPAEKMLPSSA